MNSSEGWPCKSVQKRKLLKKIVEHRNGSERGPDRPVRVTEREIPTPSWVGSRGGFHGCGIRCRYHG